ncbi:MAG: hypothetical protein CSB01_02210 [Bacteroidia bacterium]|nr:MAG: hypothetical protein CSB01_02210 [Bacteroidia bacterium]
MNLNKLILILLFGVSTVQVWGQTKIVISDSTYAKIELRVYAYENLLTHKKKQIAQKKLNNKGEITFNLPIKESQLLYIPIYSFRLQLESAFLQLKSYNNREIPLFIAPENSLNQAITQYDKEYNLFLKKNFKKIYKRKNGTQYIAKIKELATHYSSDYFASYATYKEAYLEYVSGKRYELFDAYFSENPLLLHNTAYVSLLRKLAKEIATDFAQNLKDSEYSQHFLRAKTYSKLTNIANRLKKTKDKAFNEHLFIYVLYSSLQQKLISKQLVLEKLQIIAKHSPYPINKSLSKSIVKQNKETFRGAAAPSFSLKATNGKQYSEAILKTDKPTIIAFFDSSVNNQESTTTLHKLQQKHKDSFQVVVFGCEKALKGIPKAWKQFPIPYYSYIIKDYHLGRFPYYLLIDKNGNIAKQTWQQYLISLEE